MYRDIATVKNALVGFVYVVTACAIAMYCSVTTSKMAFPENFETFGGGGAHVLNEKDKKKFVVDWAVLAQNVRP